MYIHLGRYSSGSGKIIIPRHDWAQVYRVWQLDRQTHIHLSLACSETQVCWIW